MAENPRRPLTPPAVATLREAAYDDRVDTRLPQRNVALITLLYDTGLPLKTLLAADTTDLHNEVRRLQILTDIPKDRLTTTTPDGGAIAQSRQYLTLDRTNRIGTRRLLRTYFRHRWKDTPALFPSQEDDRLTARGVRHFVTTLADTADLDPPLPGWCYC